MMKQIRQLCVGFVLILALSLPALAGDMPLGVTGDIIQNGLTGHMPQGDIGQMPTGVTGEMPLGVTDDIQNGITGHISCPGITGDLLSLIFALFA
jgi:hypothetical protein